MSRRLGGLLLLFCLPLFARDLGSRPLILVHGYGPEKWIQLTKVRQHLIDDGIASSQILLTTYDSKASSDETLKTVGDEVQKFLAGFPPGTHFDVIGHS